MFDGFNNLLSKFSEKFIKMNKLEETDDKFLNSMAKFLRWWTLKATPFLIVMAVSGLFLKLTYIWFDKFGYEKTLITMFALALLLGRSINQNLRKPI